MFSFEMNLTPYTDHLIPPRIHADLQDAGVAVSRKKVASLMRDKRIAGISPRTWHPPTTVHGDDPFPVPDLVERQFDQGERDLAWFSDITYLRTGEGWAYLCVVRDGHTRRVLGRCVADNMHTDLVEAALRQAVALRGALPRKVIFHADRGTQYTSGQLADAARELGVLRSMGRTGVSLLTGYSTGEPWRRHAEERRVRRGADARVQHVSHDGQGSPAARAA